MFGHREMTVDDYKAILRRRWLWVLVPAVLGPIIGYGISLAVPNRYTSQTLVLVEEQKVPDNFVKPVITEDLDERLATMQQQILSRTRLQPIIERFGLYKDENLSLDDKLEEMRSAITVQPVQSDIITKATGGVPGFSVSFTSNDPRVAQQVCSEITSMFMSENLRDREQSAQGTTDFLAGQLQDAKRKLDEEDAKLAQFQKKYMGQLPGQESTNLQILGALNTQLDAVTQNLNRLQQDKTYTESLLAQQLTTLQSQGGDNPLTLQQQLDNLQAQLVTLETRYTPDHPDVVKAKNDIKALQDKIKAANKEAKQSEGKKDQDQVAEPEDVQRLRAQLKSLNLGIQDKMKAQGRIQRQIKDYEARVQLSPVVEEQFKSLTRDYQTALQFYNDLLTKKSQSEMATDLERRQQGEQFRIMDPANLPDRPTFPNRPLFSLGGLGAGLALGLGFVFLREVEDKAIRTEEDVAALLELPTLALLPSVEEPRNGRHILRRESKQVAERA